MSLDDRELARLREVAALNLGDTINDARLDALVSQAARELDASIAAISVVLDAAQYFIASHGLGDWVAAAKGTPGEWAFCRHAVDSREPFVVDDAGNHVLVRDNPLVRVDGIRSYLGVPLISKADEAIGTLCVLGLETRSFSTNDVEKLRALASEVLDLLEARRSD